MPNEPIACIALIGFGEAGGILGHDLAARGLDVSTYDILLDASASREAMLAKARSSKVRAAENLADASRNAQLVVSAVTAASAPGVAADASRLLGVGQAFLYINSVSSVTILKMAYHFE